MISTPKIVRMISGRIRMYSELPGMKLAGMGHLYEHFARVGGWLPGTRPNRFLNVWLLDPLPLYALDLLIAGLFEDARVLRADGGHESLGVGPHPEHQQQQRKNRGPLPAGEVVHVVADRFRGPAVKGPLVQPQHVAGRE